MPKTTPKRLIMLALAAVALILGAILYKQLKPKPLPPGSHVPIDQLASAAKIYLSLMQTPLG